MQRSASGPVLGELQGNGSSAAANCSSSQVHYSVAGCPRDLQRPRLVAELPRYRAVQVSAEAFHRTPSAPARLGPNGPGLGQAPIQQAVVCPGPAVARPVVLSMPSARPLTPRPAPNAHRLLPLQLPFQHAGLRAIPELGAASQWPPPSSACAAMPAGVLFQQHALPGVSPQKQRLLPSGLLCSGGPVAGVPPVYNYPQWCYRKV